jgi:hypothetical protein
MQNKKEHLEWAKKRAHEYVDIGDLPNAMASMISDLGKYEGTDKWDNTFLAFMSQDAIMFVIPKGANAMKHWIDGFN